MEVTGNMKNHIVNALALLLSINCCFPGMLAEAEEPEEKAETAVDVLSGIDLEGPDNQNNLLLESVGIQELPQFHTSDNLSLLEYQNNSDEDKDDKENKVEDLTEIRKIEKIEESTGLEDSGLRQLQIPQKLEVVIDPWEMDGKGQIYSEEYVIRNDGEMPGLLTLSNLACKVTEQNGVAVTTNPAGLHDDSEKSIYMQMIFGNGDCVCLSRESSTYEAELQPGEELSVHFEGEVNENASESWREGDVAVNVVYSWELVSALEDANEKEEISEDIDSDVSGEETDEDKEEPVDGGEQIKEELEENEEPVQSKEEEEKQEEREIPEVIVLRDFNPVEFVVNEWERNEEGQLCSRLYMVRNEGESVGVFTLSDLLDISAEQDGIVVQTETEELQNSSGGSGSDFESVHVELVLENGEKIVFSQEPVQGDLEESGYKVVLKPGEEWKFRFVREMDGAEMEELQKGNITVKAIGLWAKDETMVEE